MKRRLGLLYWSIRNTCMGGSLRHWIYNTFGPDCTWWGKRRIQHTKTQEGCIIVQLSGVASPLYYPQQLPLRPLYQVITELLYDWNWHYYQIPPTTVTSTDVVYDCGSAEGLFALQAAESGARVIAFEPLPDFVKCLQRTLSRFPRAKVEHLALGHQNKTVYLQENGIYSLINQQPPGLPIPLSTIDHYIEKGGIPPTLIKADIEGQEPQLLQGAMETIRKYRPRIAITVYHQQAHADQLKKVLKQLVPEYHFRTKGIAAEHGSPVMLHAWT